jgi:4-diphosphocytidyl-2-C-methyl-D-erythritol kinase
MPGRDVAAARARRVVATARAKLNLGLAVGPRRPDGFHDLATVFQSVTLADTLVAVPRRAGFTLRVRHEDASFPRVPGSRRGVDRVPGGRQNLVLRAARLVASRTGLAAGAAFTLTKRIPTRAGLGGGSADAAAALAALDVLYGLRLGRRGRVALGAQLGSDVPFAALGGTALGLGRGERLTPLALQRPFRCAIALPGWQVSTTRAFHQIDRRKYGLTTWVGNLRVALGMGRRRVNPLRAMRLGNTFEEALGGRRREFERIRAQLLEAGAVEVRMTGSGSAVFGILGPDTPLMEVAGRYAGREALFMARSARAGVTLRKLP